MRILITGSEGMLGQDLLKVLTPEHEIIPLTMENADITCQTALNNFLKNFPDPQAIIHAAAYTDVDGAEANPEAALAVNRDGTAHLVELASRLDIPMIYVSTDYIFNGQSTRPYQEDDPTAPINKYGVSKLAGEIEVRKLKKFFIARTAWLYGKNGKNFVTTMLRLAEKKQPLKVVADQKGAPTYSRDVAAGLARLVSSSAYGIYHLTNSGETTWYDYAVKIFELAGLRVPVAPVASRDYARPAARPGYSVLSHRRWLQNNFPEFRSWEEALADFLLNDLRYNPENKL